MNPAHPETRRDYRLNFEQEIRILNPEQRVAVDQTEGPVLVIAGPGTGKTQILAARIGNILKRTDTQARNILCLTFTENGQVEMRNRLFTLIGPDAYQVHIHTFHSFCNLVIQENISQFGKLGLEPISELEEMELIHRVMDTMRAGNPLKRYKGDIYAEWRKLANLFRLMKKEAWTPAYLKERIGQYRTEIPDRPEFRYQRAYKENKAGDPKKALIEAEVDRMISLEAAVDLFDPYQEMLQEQSRYTYEDMILWVIRAFRENPILKAEYQERFLYILVDEFQDTSGSQNQLLTLLTDFWEEPNIFVVGDDDQSIFSFQDANVANIRDFASRFGNKIFKVVLKENYRSTQAILDTAGSLISHNKERIVLDDPTLTKELVSANPSLPVPPPTPEVIRYRDPLQETAAILARIEDLIAAGTSPSGIAVIYRLHRQGEDLVALMTKKSIPINIRRKLDILKLPFVRKILTLLEYISLESREAYSGDDLLFQLLHYDFFGIRPVRIARLSIAVSEKNHHSGTSFQSVRRAISEEVLDQAPGLFDSPDQNELRRASDALEYLIGNADNLTIQNLFEELVRRAGILTYIMQSPEKAWLIEVLQSLFSFIRETNKKEPELDVQRLVKILRLMEANDISVELENVVSSAEGVTLVTAHGSKGSEFSHVFLMGCNSNIWDDVNSRNRYGFKFPDNLHSSQNAVDPLEESRRLFYVAMTRAKTHLYI
ncbi:MAG TPA: ATP-dependent helicase, partial [Chitinophagaceae bacterium]|nr:ATP-dependent helicase [Chitinophagaceae bacterium]